VKQKITKAEAALIELLRQPVATHRRIVLSVAGSHWTVHTKELDNRQGDGKSFAEAWAKAFRKTAPDPT
jgi:hypothetical protein